MSRLKSTVFIFIIMSTSFLGPFGGNMILPMFKNLKDAFNVNIFMISLSIMFFMVPFSVIQLFSGPISDILGGKRTFISSGLALYSTGSMLAFLSPVFHVFLLSRFIQGVGIALVSPLVMALVGDHFKKRLRGRVMGGVAVSITLGSTIGPLAGGYFASTNWRTSFLFLAIITLLITLLSITSLPVKQERLRNKKEKAWSKLKKGFLHRGTLTIGLIGFMLFFTRTNILTYLSDILTLKPYRLTEKVIGEYLSLSGFGGLPAGIMAGILTDKIGRKKTTFIGLICSLIFSLLFLQPINLTFLFLLLFLLGFSTTMTFTPLNTLAVEVNPSMRATATSIYGFTRFLGYALGPTIIYPLYLYSGFNGVITASIFTLLLGIALLNTLKPL